jgi:glycogen operon protein
MTDADWRDDNLHALGMLINGEAADEIDSRGRPVRGDTLFLIINNREGKQSFVLPELAAPGEWTELVNSAADRGQALGTMGATLAPFSLVLLRYVLAAVPAPAKPDVPQVLEAPGVPATPAAPAAREPLSASRPGSESAPRVGAQVEGMRAAQPPGAKTRPASDESRGRAGGGE